MFKGFGESVVKSSRFFIIWNGELADLLASITSGQIHCFSSKGEAH